MNLDDSAVAAVRRDFPDLDDVTVATAAREVRAAIARGEVRASPVGFLRARLRAARDARAKAAPPDPNAPHASGAFRRDGSWDHRLGPATLDVAILAIVRARRDHVARYSPAQIAALARELGAHAAIGRAIPFWDASDRWDLWGSMPAFSVAAAVVKYAGHAPTFHWHQGLSVPGASTECPECIEADRALAGPAPRPAAAFASLAGDAIKAASCENLAEPAGVGKDCRADSGQREAADHVGREQDAELPF